MIATAVATVHTPHITGMADLAPSAVQAKTRAGFAALGRALREAEPDVLVAFTSEHVVNITPRCAPPFLLGTGPSHRIYDEPLFHLPTGRVSSHPEFAQGLLAACGQSGVDLAHSTDLALDHGTVLPLHLMGVLDDIPVVVVIINSLFRPLPDLGRCWALGQVVGEYARDGWPGRVALLATGGISHSVGDARMGSVDVEFDRRFVTALRSGDDEELRRLTDGDLDAAGNGTHEVRNWLALRAAVPGWRAEAVVAEPLVEGWGTGVYQFQWAAPTDVTASAREAVHA